MEFYIKRMQYRCQSSMWLYGNSLLGAFGIIITSVSPLFVSPFAIYLTISEYFWIAQKPLGLSKGFVVDVGPQGLEPRTNRL